jgi:hypothetical protein
MPDPEPFTMRSLQTDRQPVHRTLAVRAPLERFPVDCVTREDYRIVGKNKDTSVAKAFFAARFSLFHSYE